MSNLFQEVLTDARGVEERLLGPTYPYYKNIKTPSEIGMSDKGTISALGKDILDSLIWFFCGVRLRSVARCRRVHFLCDVYCVLGKLRCSSTSSMRFSTMVTLGSRRLRYSPISS